MGNSHSLQTAPQRSCWGFPSAGHCCFPSFIPGLNKALLSSSAVAPRGRFSLSISHLHPLGDRGIPDLSGITAIYNRQRPLPKKSRPSPATSCSFDPPHAQGYPKVCKGKAMVCVLHISRVHFYLKQVFAACVSY